MLLINNLLYFQVDRLLELREFCENLSRANSTFIISNETWKNITEFHQGLKIVAEKMLTFQRANLTLSDAYGEWIDLKGKLKCITKTSFVKKLIESMEEREKTLFDNALVSASVSLDPRLQLLLSPEQKIVAATFLRTLNEKIHGISQPSSTVSSQIESSSSTEAANSSDDGGLESILRLAEMNNENNNLPQPDHRLTIEIELFQKLKRVPFETKIHEFWHESRKKYPILYDLACIVMAVPPTEVSVERNFSKLNFILNRFRCRLSDKELKKFLFLSLNSDLFDLI